MTEAIVSRPRLPRLVKHAFLILVGFVMLYPLLWMIASSLKPNALIFRDPSLIPRQLDTDAFFIFLMVQFFRTIPRELTEAANIDGAGHGRIFLQIMLPLSVPALATTAIFTFIWTWNDFFGQLIFLTDPDKYTVPVALRTFVDSTAGSS